MNTGVLTIQYPIILFTDINKRICFYTIRRCHVMPLPFGAMLEFEGESFFSAGHRAARYRVTHVFGLIKVMDSFQSRIGRRTLNCDFMNFV